jgi:hypothetical protein
VTQVINTHHYGGAEKLPPNSVYIGRPSKHGNRYSSKKGNLNRAECVAFHRLDIYEQLIKNPKYLLELKQELEGKNLGCWCKQLNREEPCHGDNFVHIFKDINKTRDYTKSVVFYLMEDLRRAITTLKEWVIKEPSSQDFLGLYISVFESSAEVAFLITVLKDKKPNSTVIAEYISRLVIDLEMAVVNKDNEIKKHWLKHAVWNINKILYPEAMEEEPVLMKPVLKRKRKV